MKHIICFILCLLLFSVSIFSRSLEDILESGVLRVGMLETIENVTITPDGEYKGFNYDLVNKFADYLGVKLEIVLTDSFSDYFKKDGEVPENVQTDDSIVYNPDIFENDVVDIVADFITRLPWREKLFNMTDVIKNRQVIFSSNRTIWERNINVRRPFSELSDVTFIIREHTSYEDNFRNNIKPKIEDVKAIYTRQGDNYCSSKILDGDAHFGVIDSIAFLGQNVLNNRRLTMCYNVSPMEDLCWVSPKANNELNAKLAEFFNEEETHDTISSLFVSYFNMSYGVYMDILSN